MKKAVILLSGGLDSLVALGFPQSEYRIELALTFDYGQKSVQNEIDASQKICKYYNVEHKVIKLEWLKEITKTALVSAEEIPVANLGTKESAAAVWIPNRNGLFLNIACVLAPLINYTKNDIVRIAIENAMPLELVRSCYGGGEKHCGMCESCRHLKQALIANHGEKYIEILFGNYEN